MSILSRVVGLISAESGEKSERAPHFAVMSPISERADEKKILLGLFENGLSAFHLRRPRWPIARVKAWLEELPPQIRSRVILHQFPQLVRRCGAGGFHIDHGEKLPLAAKELGEISARCEDFQSMLKVAKFAHRIMLGPVFPPEKYDVTVPRRTLEEYAACARYWRAHGGKNQMLAFGGVNEENVKNCRKAGFDGFVAVGAVWDADSPVKAFKKLLRKW